jgi:hypothetical protein
MTRFGFNLLLASMLAAFSAQSAGTNSAPDFKEVYDLVRQHLAGATDADLNCAAVNGLFTSLRGKVSLVAAGATTTPQTNVALVSKSTASPVPIWDRS